MIDLENNENIDDLKENQNVEIMMCLCCGSNLKLKSIKQKLVICDYCGEQNIINKQEENKFKEKLNKVFSIFEKKPADPEKEIKKKQKEEEKKLKAEQKEEKKAEKKEKFNEKKKEIEKTSLEFIIANTLNKPGVKVDREEFLREYLSDKTDDIDLVIEKGPVEAGVSEKVLRRLGEKLITDRSSKIKNVLLHNKQNNEICGGEVIKDDNESLCLALKLAQELVYLYGVKDIKNIDNDKIKNSFLFYIKVILETPLVVSRSKDVIDLLNLLKFSSKKKSVKNKKVLKKNSKKKNLKSKKVLKPTNPTKMKNKLLSKENLQKGMGKLLTFLNLPTIGDIVSFAISFTSIKPMATQLLKTLENINFHYSEEELKKDIEIFESMNENDKIFEVTEENYKVTEELDEFEKIKKLKGLLDIGAISQEEFDKKKKELLGL